MSGLQPANGQIVENAVLHLLQIVVIGVEDLLGLRDIDVDARRFLPRQHRQPLDVVAGQAVIGGHRRHASQAAEFLQRLFLHVVGHAGRFDLLPQLFGIARGFVLLAQFLLDGLHLLAQVVLALRLLYAVLHFALNLVAQLLNFQLLRQVLVDLLQPHLDVGRLQHVLLVARRERRQRGGDEVDHAAGIVDVRRPPSKARPTASASPPRSAGTASAHCAAGLRSRSSSRPEPRESTPRSRA